MRNILLLALLCALMLGGCKPPPEPFPYRIVTPDGWPVYADSVRAEGYCIDYWHNGRLGRVCGPYTVIPQ